MESSAHVQSICDSMEVPHLETRWSYRLDKDTYSVNLYPYYTVLSKAFIELITFWQWKTITILYEDNEGKSRD